MRHRQGTNVAALCDPELRAPLEAQARALGARVDVQAFGHSWEHLLAAYAALQGDEIRQHLGGWIAAQQPRFGANVAPRFASLGLISAAEVESARRWRGAERLRLCAALQPDAAFVFPTAPCIALALDARAEQRSRFYRRALAINAIAGHAGLPQVTLQAGNVAGAPVGLSIVGAPGTDLALLALAAAWRVPGRV